MGNDDPALSPILMSPVNRSFQESQYSIASECVRIQSTYAIVVPCLKPCKLISFINKVKVSQIDKLSADSPVNVADSYQIIVNSGQTLNDEDNTHKQNGLVFTLGAEDKERSSTNLLKDNE